MNRITKLHELDFSPGIRASYINENFDLLRRWIEEERLRVSGWGIVEGFELSRNLNDYTISIGDGIIIDKTGAHLEIKGETINAGRPKAWNKLETLQQVLRTYSELDHTEYSMANVAYVGDDLLDLQCMIPIKQAGGIVACPNDAVEAVKAISDYISTKNAGNGAVREIIDEIAHEKHISHL